MNILGDNTNYLFLLGCLKAGVVPVFWKWFKQKINRTIPIEADQDLTYPERKEKITVPAIREKLQDMDDLIIKELWVNKERVTMIYINTLVDSQELQELVIAPLDELDRLKSSISPEAYLKNAELVEEDNLPSLIYDIVSGATVLLFEQRELFLKIDTYSAPDRSITPTENESTVLGPQDSFVESLDTNISMLRRRIISSHLKVKTFILGTETQNKVAVMYMENLANRENLERVFHRLENIEYHGFTGLPVLVQMLEDKPFSPFPQFGITPRPDNATAALLEGRILVMLKENPETVILPSTFFEMFSSPEDFYNRWTSATLLRGLRFAGFFVSILLTSTYVSVLTYHPEMLPPQLLRLLAESRARVPFPPVIEVLLMELVIEILREAGTRMPTKIGQTIGIVGGIVIGTAAVEAGLSSNILIVLVAITALTSFVPATFLMSNSIRFVRYVFIIAAGVQGIYGQMILFALLMNHLLNLTSLGSPYMTPVIPRRWTDLLNGVVRAPIQFLVTRMDISRAKKQLTRPLDEE